VGELWRVLAPKRMEIVRAMTGAGPLTIREVARRVDRDFKAVHSDVTMLANAGIVVRTDSGAVEFPYDRVHVEFDMMAA
jgi:predicted transcriptional regulator